MAAYVGRAGTECRTVTYPGAAEFGDNPPLCIAVNLLLSIKLHAEVFDAPYAFLISSKEIIEETRRFLSKRYLLLSYGAYRKVYIAKFDVATQTIDEKRWYPEYPFKHGEL